MNEKILFDNLNYFGCKYKQEFLINKFELKRLENNPWEGFKFIFNYTFLRGRKDKLSSMYSGFSIDRITEYFNLNSNNEDNILEYIKNHKDEFDYKLIYNLKNNKKKNYRNDPIFDIKTNENGFIKKLAEEIEVKDVRKGKNKKIIKLGNDKDIMMVLDFFKKISCIEFNGNKNLFTWIKNEIKSSRGDDVYDKLKCYQVNDKILSCIIRDVILLNNLNYDNKVDDKYLFPIDTWVRQLYALITKKEDNDSVIKNYFISKCKELKYSIPLVAAGCWYVSANSFDTLINILPKYSLK